MRTDDEGPRYNEDELRSMQYWSDRSEAQFEADYPRCLGCGSRGCDNPNCGPLDRDE